MTFSRSRLALASSVLLPVLGIPAVHAATNDETVTLKTVTVTENTLPETTENSDSYTTGNMYTATKMDMSVHETPQSVSVITNTQMQDFNLNNINDVLKSATGITVEQVETDRTYYTSRGFEINNFQVDGIGQPLNWSIMNGDLDTVIYDRIEVVRGATGLMSGAGNPSATVNRVRKRPTADRHLDVELSRGSWNDKRLETDFSQPFSDKVRGRFITAYQKEDSYIRDYAHEKYIVYGILESDITDTTLLSAGFSQQRNDADSPMWGALPLYYSNGIQTDYDVSTSTSADWAYWDNTSREMFVELLQEFSSQWNLRAIYTHRKREEESELFYTYGAPDPVTQAGLTGYASAYDLAAHSDLLDVYVNGSFNGWGLEHDIIIGASLARNVIEENSLYDYTTGLGFPAIGNFNLWNGDTPHPVFADGYIGSDFYDRQNAIYAATRLHATDKLAVIAGSRIINWKSEGDSYGASADMEEKNKVIPYVGVIYDITPEVAIYSSYTETFMPQSTLDSNLKRMKPADGNNAEIGVKTVPFNGRLNTTSTIFKTSQRNIAEYAGYVAGKSIYDGKDYDSKGAEMEVAGRVTEGLELTVGYTYVDINDKKGKDAKTYVPKHLLKITSSYKLPVEPEVKIGARINWQSQIETSSLTYATSTVKQEAYTLIDIFSSYAITRQLKASLNINNITNEKYIASLLWEQGFYGSPRNVTASIRWSY